MNPLLEQRRCGVLLHPTSLPGPGPTGTLGAAAYRFVDFLVAGGFTVWQTLPIGPADSFGSPYCQQSSYAGDVRLLDVDALSRSRALPAGMAFEAVRCDPTEAYRSFARLADGHQRNAFTLFMRQHRRWVFSHAMFEVCRAAFDGRVWWEWPQPYRDHEWRELIAIVDQHRDQFRGIVFQQYLFDTQWRQLKTYANERGVCLFGDLPFYVDRNSVDIWAGRRLFRLDADGQPVAVAGVPPDYFNEDGQYWGNPLYDWARMRDEHFDWWTARLRGQLRHFDMLRIDHFRALQDYWEIPYGAESAREGSWQPGVGRELLSALRELDGTLPLVAEDLGVITEEVYALRDEFELAGMTVLQFAFDGDSSNPHLPANYRENSVAYTGTHDNDTLHGWYGTLSEDTRRYIEDVLDIHGRPMPEQLLSVLYASKARLAIVPMQDLLGLGSEARMNTPGRVSNNWSWRFTWRDVGNDIPAASRQRAAIHGRLIEPASDS